jgi:hypothetical protein
MDTHSSYFHSSSSSSPDPTRTRPPALHVAIPDTPSTPSRFPPHHILNPYFTDLYYLGDKIGTGGYGFVMTARPRAGGPEVAVKFIDKSKVPNTAWMEHEVIVRLPSEIMLLNFVQHENIVRCLDVFEDPLYFYLVRRFLSHMFMGVDDRIWI